MPRPPRVYLITDRFGTAGRPLPGVVAAALAGVAGRRATEVAVQLREKDLGGRALLELARTLRATTARAGARLFVNDRVDVALAAGADGVHLGGGALAPADAHAVAPDLEIAISTHAPNEVAAAAAAGHAAFAVFGPVFDTPSKRAFGPPQGEAALAAAAAAGGVRLPVLALGGISADNVIHCVAGGAAGIACIRSVLAAPDPGAALTRIFEAIEST